jgi:small subunit ribosomal protein S13
MARLLGVDIPNNKKVAYSLTAIFGIGISTAKKICKTAHVDENKKVVNLNQEEFAALRDAASKYTIEGDLRRKISMDIKQLMEINCYRGIRHKRKLPVRGQRTKTNARTRKGPRKTSANKKQETK